MSGRFIATRAVRRACFIVLALTLAVALAPQALAAPPGNDDFAAASDLALPASVSVDVSEATLEASEPAGACWSVGKTVWYRLQLTQDQIVKLDTSTSPLYDRVLNVYRDTGGGVGGLEFVACGYPWSPTIARLSSGETYYVQAAAASWSGGGTIALDATVVPPPTNDDLADALEIGSLPYSDLQESYGATVEPNEPAPSCAGERGGTIWYAFTASTAGSYTASTLGLWYATIAVYRGSPGALTETSCRSYSSTQTVTVASGETVYFQVGVDLGGAPSLGLGLDVAPVPYADFSAWPGDPSPYEDVWFSAYASDPGGNGIVRQRFDFGDGTSADGCCVPHRFPADGDYTVTLSVETSDGRTGSAQKVVSVRTHDVSIGVFDVPTSGRPLRTKQITVGVSNRRYQENVTVQLYRSVPGGDFQLVGSSTQLVKVRTGYKTTPFVFSYTFTEQDAAAGKVTFKAVAVIEGARDALPADNTVIAPATKVR